MPPKEQPRVCMSLDAVASEDSGYGCGATCKTNLNAIEPPLKGLTKALVNDR
jgi:hypothetical protein